MKAAHTLPPEDVMAYLDGELNGDEARDIQAHLASCPECQRLSAELREGSMQLREWSVEDARLTFVAVLVSVTDAEGTTEPDWSRATPRTVLTPACGQAVPNASKKESKRNRVDFFIRIRKLPPNAFFFLPEKDLALGR